MNSPSLPAFISRRKPLEKTLKYTIIQDGGPISEVLLHLKTINTETRFENNRVTAGYVNSTEMAVEDQSLFPDLSYQTKGRVHLRLRLPHVTRYEHLYFRVVTKSVRRGYILYPRYVRAVFPSSVARRSFFL